MTIPNKGTAIKVYSGEKDKKTNEPLIIQLVFDFRTLPVIGKVYDFPPVEIPRMMVKPYTVLLFKSNRLNVIPEQFNYQWLQSVIIKISSIKQWD